MYNPTVQLYMIYKTKIKDPKSFNCNDINSRSVQEAGSEISSTIQGKTCHNLRLKDPCLHKYAFYIKIAENSHTESVI